MDNPFSIAGDLVLKAGRDRSLLNRHPWVFSGAVQSWPSFEDGALLRVVSHTKVPLGVGYFNRNTSLSGRMIAWGNAEPRDAVLSSIEGALALRSSLFADGTTTAYRLINGEGDGLPGLVVDKYSDLLVLQVSTLGMEKLKASIVELLSRTCKPKAIWERSILPSRKEEGLADAEGLLYGEELSEVEFKENGLRFILSLSKAQKTGFFLDQREMRSLVRSFSKGKKVLNCFSFSGGHSVYALAGGARSVHSVDISEDAVSMAERNVELNFPDTTLHTSACDDVFKFLRSRSERYDLIVLDPPAFAKKKNHIAQAAKGYNEINRLAISMINKGGVIVTSSCSYHITEELFSKIIFGAARDAGRVVRCIGTHRQAQDHPVSVFHPEGKYLKSLVLFVE